MVKSLILCLIILLFWSVNTEDSCKPLWPRVEFGKTFAVSSDQQKMVIKFNTRSTCQNSYVTVSDSSGNIRKVPCTSSTIGLSGKMNNYASIIQRCSLVQIPFDEQIQYIAYGSNSSSSPSIPFSSNPINTSILSPQRKQVKFIVLADWSQLDEKIGTYDSLNGTLDAITQQLRIDGIIVNGDIAYDLDSNNGTNYQLFLNLISRIARKVPIFLNTGNHEHNSKDDLDLFYGTFEQYGKDKKLAIGLNLGPLYLIGFDPYEVLYSTKSSLRAQLANSASFQSYLGLQQYLKAGKQTQKILITSSHYPLMCSAPNKNCQKDKILLKDYFDLMFQSDVQLYMGAHYHTYQRIYPYCQNGSIQISQTPYTLDKCLISIIDAIAGNDDKIVESYPVLQPFTAKVSFGQTGFGLLSVKQAQVKYQHFSTKNLINLQDQFTINYLNKNKTPHNQILVIDQ